MSLSPRLFTRAIAAWKALRISRDSVANAARSAIRMPCFSSIDPSSAIRRPFWSIFCGLISRWIIELWNWHGTNPNSAVPTWITKLSNLVLTAFGPRISKSMPPGRLSVSYWLFPWWLEIIKSAQWVCSLSIRDDFSPDYSWSLFGRILGRWGFIR